MSKSNVTLSIETEILDAVRRTGVNMSEICEQALAVHVNWIKNAPGFYDIFEEYTEDKNKFLNKMVHHVARSGYPGVTKKWTERIKQDFDTHVDGYELFKFAKELIDDG